MGTTRSYACTIQTALTRLGSNVRRTSRVLLGMGARRATLVSLLLWRRVLQRLPRLQGSPQKPVAIAGAQLCPWNARRKLYQQVGNFVGSVAGLPCGVPAVEGMKISPSRIPALSHRLIRRLRRGNVWSLASRYVWSIRSKHFSMSVSNTYFGVCLILRKIAPIASWVERPGRKP